MKRFMLFAVALLLTALFPLDSHGQTTLRGLIEDDAPITEDSVPPQRIGIPQFDVNLSANGTGSVTGYCFDEYLIAPRRTTTFQNVLAGDKDAVVRTGDGRTMTLKDAIAKGDVAVKALQLRVMFANNSGGPITIKAKSPIVLWDRPGGSVSQGALDVLKNPTGDYDHQQKMVWRETTAERMLAVLGYYDGSVWNINRDQFQMATARFQRDNGLDADGKMSSATVAALLNINDQFRARLRSLGFRDQEGRSIREDLAAQIKAYQRYLGQKPTGRWSPELGARLATDERLAPQLSALKVDGRSIADVLADNAKVPDMLTYLKADKGLLVMMESADGVELWNCRGRNLSSEGRNEIAFRKIDDAAARMAGIATKGDRLVLYPHIGKGGTVALVVGNKSIEVDAEALNRYLDGGDLPKDVAAVLNPLMPASGSDMTGRRDAPKLVVYRGPLVQGRTGLAPLRRAGLDQIDGAMLATALDRTYGDRTSVYVSDDLRLGARQVGSEDMGSIEPVHAGSSRLALAR